MFNDCLTPGITIRGVMNVLWKKKKYFAINYAVFFILRVLIGYLRRLVQGAEDTFVVDRAFRNIVTLLPCSQSWIITFFRRYLIFLIMSFWSFRSWASKTAKRTFSPAKSVF
jgi:hypothetical protein